MVSGMLAILRLSPQCSNGGAPSIDGECCAVNETGTIRRQEDNGLSNLLLCSRKRPRPHWLVFEKPEISVCLTDPGFEPLRAFVWVRRVHRLKTRVGDAVVMIGEDVWEMATDQPGHLRHRLEPAVGGTPEPAGVEPCGRSMITRIPRSAGTVP
jgi:hypothetical protein